MVQELEIAVASFPTCKAPGEDGVLIKIYKEYGETILPALIPKSSKRHLTLDFCQNQCTRLVQCYFLRKIRTLPFQILNVKYPCSLLMSQY